MAVVLLSSPLPASSAGADRDHPPNCLSSPHSHLALPPPPPHPSSSCSSPSPPHHPPPPPHALGLVAVMALGMGGGGGKGEVRAGVHIKNIPSVISCSLLPWQRLLPAPRDRGWRERKSERGNGSRDCVLMVCVCVFKDVCFSLCPRVCVCVCLT